MPPSAAANRACLCSFSHSVAHQDSSISLFPPPAFPSPPSQSTRPRQRTCIPASHSLAAAAAMSGWDEGAVFYSDQAQFPRGGPGGDPTADLTRHSTLHKFKEFLRGFTGPTGDFPYRESLVHNRDHVTVAIEDLDAFDAELSDKIRKSPADYLPLFETAAAEVLGSLRSKVAGETGEMEEPLTGDVQIFLASKENCMSMRSIGADYMSKSVKIAGIAIAASRGKAKATHVTLVCKNCCGYCPSFMRPCSAAWRRTLSPGPLDCSPR